MQLKEIKDLIIRPALDLAGLWSPGAENLLIGTGLVESGFQYLKQIDGPALSWFMIEPKTHEYLKGFLKQHINRSLSDRILSACFLAVYPDDNALVWNLRYSCLMARIKYYSTPCKIPDPEDFDSLTKTYLKYYNTSLGKSTYEKSIELFKEACQQ